MSQQQPQMRPINPINAILGLVGFALVIFLLFTLAKGIFTILSWVAPLLFIASLFLDKSVAINHGKFLIDKLKNNTLFGVGATVLSILAFPLLSGYFFIKALAKKKINEKIKEFEEEKQGKYTEYEEVEDDFLTLPKLEKSDPVIKKQAGNDYEEMF